MREARRVKPFLRRIMPTTALLLASFLLLGSMLVFRMKNHALELERDRFAPSSSFVVTSDGVSLSDLGPFAVATLEVDQGIILFEANCYESVALPYHDGPGLSGSCPEALVGFSRFSEVQDGNYLWGGVAYKVVGTLGEKDESLLSDTVVLTARGLLSGCSSSSLRFDGFGARGLLTLVFPGIEAQGLTSALSSRLGEGSVVALFTWSALLVGWLGVLLGLLCYARGVRDEYRVRFILGNHRSVLLRGSVELVALLLGGAFVAAYICWGRTAVTAFWFAWLLLAAAPVLVVGLIAATCLRRRAHAK